MADFEGVPPLLVHQRRSYSCALFSKCMSSERFATVQELRYASRAAFFPSIPSYGGDEALALRTCGLRTCAQLCCAIGAILDAERVCHRVRMAGNVYYRQPYQLGACYVAHPQLASCSVRPWCAPPVGEYADECLPHVAISIRLLTDSSSCTRSHASSYCARPCATGHQSQSTLRTADVTHGVDAHATATTHGRCQN